MPTDIEIARAARLRPATDVARDLGIPDDALHPYGRHIAKVDLRLHRHLGRPSFGQAHPRHRDQPHARRRGQDDDDGGPRRRPEPHRPQGDDLPARTFARPVLRHEGWRGRRRLFPGRPDGADQPAFHGRFPRDHRSEQPARSPAGQSYLLGQRTRHRSRGA